MVSTFFAPNIPIINLSWLLKILAMITLIWNSWFLDYMIDICIYNQWELFISFVNLPIVLAKVTFVEVFLS